MPQSTNFSTRKTFRSLMIPPFPLPPTLPEVIFLPKFNIKPEYHRRKTFVPPTTDADNIKRRAQGSTRSSQDLSAPSHTTSVPTPAHMDGTSRDHNFDPGNKSKSQLIGTLCCLKGSFFPTPHKCTRFCPYVGNGFFQDPIFSIFKI